LLATLLMNKQQHNLTFYAAGTQGGGPAAIDIVTDGQNFLGYPTYCVVCPDKDMSFDVCWPPTAACFDPYIQDCGVGSIAANFSAANTEFCQEGTVQFPDESVGNVTSWVWTFENGDPASSTEQNPVVQYESPGVFDVSFLRAIPNMTLFAPRDEKSFHQAVAFAAAYEHPCSLRYPRGAFLETKSLPESAPFVLAKSQLLLSSESDTVLIGYGNGVGRAYATAKLLDEPVTILDLRFVKPLDSDMLREMAKKHKKWFVFSDTSKMGGVGSALLEFLADEKILDVTVVSFEYGDSFITHGNTKVVEESLGLLPEQLAKRVQELV